MAGPQPPGRPVDLVGHGRSHGEVALAASLPSTPSLPLGELGACLRLRLLLRPATTCSTRQVNFFSAYEMYVANNETNPASVAGAVAAPGAREAGRRANAVRGWRAASHTRYFPLPTAHHPAQANFYGWYGGDMTSRYANRQKHFADIAAGNGYDAYNSLKDIGGLFLDSFLQARRPGRGASSSCLTWCSTTPP